MPTGRQRLLLRYAGSIAIMLMATWVRLLLDPVLHSELPFITYFPAVVFAAWACGFAPALVGLGLSCVLILVYSLPPQSAASPTVLSWELIRYVLVGSVVTALIDSMQTARSRAERAERSERGERQQLHVTLQSIGDAVISTDREGRVTYLNPVAEKLTGWQLSDAKNAPLTTIFKIINEATRQPVEDPVARVLREGIVVGLGNHTLLIAYDGAEIPIDDSAAPILDQSGKVAGVVLIFRDVTERRKWERLQHDLQGQLKRQVEERTAELRATEERFRLLVEGSKDYAIFMLDLRGNIVSWNPGAERIKGYRAEEIIGQHFSRFYLPEEVALDKPARELQIAAAEGKYEEEGWRLRKDGSRFWANVLITALQDQTGNLRGFSKITRDLTERKAAEDALHKAYAQLEVRVQERTAELAKANDELKAEIVWREELEEKLWQERERLSVTLASIGDGVIATNPEGKVTFLNPVAEKLTGWRHEDAFDKPLDSIFHIVNEETRRAAENPVARVLATGQIAGLANHTVLISRDGTERPIDDSAAPIRDPEGKTRGVVLVFRDNTERRRAMEDLRQSEARKAAIVATALDAIITMDHEGKIVEFNPAAEKMFGRRRDHVLGREMAEICIPSVLRENHRQGLARYLATGEGPMLNKQIEMPALRADGSEFRVELNIARIGSEGPPLFTGYLRDVSRRKQFERRRRARLAVNEILAQAAHVEEAAPRLLQAVCENLEWDVGALWTVDSAAHVLRCVEVWHSPAARFPEFEAATRQYTFAPGIGLPGRIWAQGRPAWIADVVKDANFPRGEWAGKEGLHGAFGFPILLGREVLGIVEFFSRTIQEPDPDLLEMTTTIGGQIGHVFERERASRALEEADRRKDEFLATLAHELRNPLAPIRNSLELMRRAEGDPNVPGLIREVRSIMDRQLVQLVRLVDDLLDISRITTGKLQVRTMRVLLSDVLQSAIEAARPLMESQSQQFTVALPREPIHLHADPARLAQVISNLLNNACKYTEKGGQIRLSVELVSARVVSGEWSAAEPAPPTSHHSPLTTHHAKICVRDTGVGIAAEHLPKMFRMFSQAAPALERSQGGLGIGLSLARGLVELHGGTIEARSAGPGQGSEFVVRLPIADGDQLIASQGDKAPEGIAAAGHPVASSASRPVRILVVDDNRDAAESLALMLRLMGHDIQIVHDGMQAVKAAAAFQPDLVLLDIGLPKLNGYDAARRIREQPGGTSIVLAALTGWGQEEDKRRAVEAGFDHHLVKPADLAALQSILTALSSRKL